jgi:hypothetical protein
MRGVQIGLGRIIAEEARGLSVAGNVDAREATGLVVGLFNRSRRLNGVQLGLLNFAGNNPGWARWLPLVNAHFD